MFSNKPLRLFRIVPLSLLVDKTKKTIWKSSHITVFQTLIYLLFSLKHKTYRIFFLDVGLNKTLINKNTVTCLIASEILPYKQSSLSTPWRIFLLESLSRMSLHLPFLPLFGYINPIIFLQPLLNHYWLGVLCRCSYHLMSDVKEFTQLFS